jgi:glycosyltransferase involved in cell wall biosynthesis
MLRDPITGSGSELRAGLDVPLPPEVAVGSGTALFVCGWCFAPAAGLRSLEFELGDQVELVEAFGMPRLDLFRALHPGIDPYTTAGLERDPRSPEDPALHSYASGFWGIIRIPAASAGTEPREVELSLRAALDDGGSARARLAELVLIRCSEEPAPVVTRAAAAGAPLVAICMATHNPPADLVARQIESVRRQSHERWLCLVSDDCSNARSFAALRDAIGEDDRFVVSRSPRRLGFYRNFERALSMAPDAAEYVAMADQDDDWDEDKLAALLQSIDGAQLVYSDARIVARDGELISDTYWSVRRNNHSSMLSLLSANAVTGAASLVRRDVLDYALPFPPAQFHHYHDHWIALTSLSLGEIRFVDRPLYDYVQHSSSSLGHATANLMPSLRDRIGGLRTRGPRERIRKWRMHYFVDIARLRQFATVLEMRCGDRMTAGKRRALRRILDGDRSLVTVAMLAARGIRELGGRRETLGAEWTLFGALLWRRLLAFSARDRPQRRLRLDAVPPPDLAPGPGRPTSLAGSGARTIEEKIAPLPFEVREHAPRRVNLLLPTVDLEHLFAGYIAKFNLARRLAERGARVRILTTDPTPQLPRSWTRQLESYAGLKGLTDRVELEFGRASLAIELNPGDAFIATTWWTAHIARRALAESGGGKFLYLIQEYEPFTFPMGTYAALARESYDMPHYALFSSELLRDWFRRERIGVYGEGAEDGDRSSEWFENAITAVAPLPAAELGARRPRRLLFYARPESHAVRNMFELGVLALSRAVEDGAFLSGWELHGIGTVQYAGRLALPGGVQLELVPRTQQATYGQILQQHDIGLALMYTPHPSLVPIEMAAAGMLAVTNTFANKTPEALTAISPNLIAAPPTVEGVAAALREAIRNVDDAERRARGAEVRWSRDWDSSFGDELLARIEGFLGR